MTNLSAKLLHDTKQTALVDGSDIRSYAELKKDSLKLSSALTKQIGIEPGDRVVILAHNSAEFVISYLALLASGATVIPLDPYSKESELARDLSLVKPKLIITSSPQRVPGVFAHTIEILEFHSSQWRKFLKSRQGKIVDRNPSDVAVMMMTSGASFQPRPAMLTHGSLISNLEQAFEVAELRLNPDDNVLAALPLYHIFGLHVVLGFALYCKSALAIARTFDAIELAHTINHLEITIVPGVPALFDAFAREKLVTLDSLNDVRMFISGGAPMRFEVRERFYNRFGMNVSEGYGLTEASPMVSFTSNPSKEGDIGQALPGVEIDIRDKTGSVAVAGDAGQIVVRGPNVFAGYFNDVETTKTVLDTNGWLFTGDIGVKDEYGSIVLIDRSSDVIVVSGFSVFPSEVETVLLKHELVDATSVVGELHQNFGEVPIAYVVIIDSEIDIADPKARRTYEKILHDHCEKYLARYKIPFRFEFVDELSIKASGRPLRKSLRSALTNFD